MGVASMPKSDHIAKRVHTPFAVQQREHCSSAAPFSPIISEAALVLAEVTVGITEASMTRRLSIPCTRSAGSTTAIRSMPMRQVPAGVKNGAAVGAREIEQLLIGLCGWSWQHLLVPEIAEGRLAVDVAQHPDAGDDDLAIEFGGEIARLDAWRLRLGRRCESRAGRATADGIATTRR